MSPIILSLLVAILFAVTVVMVMSLRNGESLSQKSRRKLKMSEGRLTAIGEVERDVPIHFTGKGTWSSKPIELASGQYRLRYDFSSGAPVRVGLVSSLDGEDETLLIKSGSGVEGFNVEEGGRCVVQVQPADEQMEWVIEFQHLTRCGVQDIPRP
jgi:hypothetical protein